VQPHQIERTRPVVHARRPGPPCVSSTVREAAVDERHAVSRYVPSVIELYNSSVSILDSMRLACLTALSRSCSQCCVLLARMRTMQPSDYLPLASARSGIVVVAANRQPPSAIRSVTLSYASAVTSVAGGRVGSTHAPTEVRKRFSLASARAAHPILCMKPIPFLARALAGSGCTVYHTRRRPSQARARIAASFCPRIPFPQLRLFATVLPFARPFIFALDVPGLADVGES
jgi:hypothetical protein